MLNWLLLIWTVAASLTCLNYGLSVAWLDFDRAGYVLIGLGAAGIWLSLLQTIYLLAKWLRFKPAAVQTRDAKR